METRIKVETDLNDSKKYYPQYKNLLGFWLYFKEFDIHDYVEVVKYTLQDAQHYINEQHIKTEYIKYP